MPRKEYSQYDSFILSGQWWLPDNDTERVAGELHYRSGQLELRLFGAFHKTKAIAPFHHAPDKDDIDVIHGETFREEPITLLDVTYIRYQPSQSTFLSKEPGDIVSSDLRPRSAVLGQHVGTIQEQTYSKVCLQFRNFEAWIGDRPFVPGDMKADGLTMNFSKPPRREFELPAPFGRISIVSSWKSSRTPPHFEFSMECRSNLMIEPNTPKTLDWYSKIVCSIERLLTLFAGYQIQTEKEVLFVDEGTSNRTLYYYNRHNIEEAEYSHHDFLFRFEHIRNLFAEVISKWLSFGPNIQHSLDLFFSSLRQPAPFMESRFLPMIQAIEVFARSVEEHTYVNPVDFHELLPQLQASVPNEIDSELRKAIVARLEFSNELSLRSRLRRIVSSLDESIVTMFCRDKNRFVNGVVETRNFFTHYADAESRVLQGLDLHWATRKLSTMFEILLLRWVGIPENQIFERLKECLHLRRERDQWQTAREIGEKIGVK